MNKFLMGLSLAFSCCATYGSEIVVGRVTLLEPTYLPTRVVFMMDTGSSSCPAGNYLTWQNADQNNNKATYATLMLALSMGKKVRLYVNDGDTTCIGRFLHLLSD